MKQKAVKLLLGILIIGAAVATAYWGGKTTSQVLTKPDHQALLERREQNTKDILKEMESIQEGDTLPDYEFFETLESETVRLSSLVTRPTWLIFVQPDCPACLEELDHLQTYIEKGSKFEVIVISNSNPLDLIDLQKHYQLKSLILHDRNSTYIDVIKVFTFPFNVLIDSNLVIAKIVADQLKSTNFE